MFPEGAAKFLTGQPARRQPLQFLPVTATICCSPGTRRTTCSLTGAWMFTARRYCACTPPSATPERDGRKSSRSTRSRSASWRRSCPPKFRLLAALHRSPDWALVYWDDLSAIYVKRAPDRQAFLSRAHVYAVRPDDFDSAVLQSPERLARAEQDYRARAAARTRIAPSAAYSLAGASSRAASSDEALALLEQAVALEPENAQFCAWRSARAAPGGNLDEAERRLREAIEDLSARPGLGPRLERHFLEPLAALRAEGRPGERARGGAGGAPAATRTAPAAERVRALEQKLAERRRGS